MQVVVLDEATGSVDPETDSQIQRAVREEFSDSTVLIVAHRLETILDCDEVVVMGQGRVVEMGAPADLLADPASAFRAMAVAAGIGVAPLGGARHKRKVL